MIRFTPRVSAVLALCLGLAASAAAQTPAAVVAREGSSQFAYRDLPFPKPFRAAVYDAAGAPVSGASVTFTSPATGAQALFNGALSVTVTTDGNGLTPPLTASANSTAGSYSIVASVDGVANPAHFFATNFAGGGGAVGHGQASSSNYGTLWSQPLLYGYGHLIGGCYWSAACSDVNWSTSFVSADINRDGVKDLIGFNNGYKEVSARLGNTNGGYGGVINTVVPTPNTEMWDIIAGDFNLDGIPDVALPTGTGAIRLMYSTGTGTFTAGPLLSAPGLTGIALFLATADLNGDGYLDIVTSGMHVLMGTGPGTFAPATPGGSGGGEVILTDMNADGKLDIVMGGGSYHVFVAIGNGDGTFAATEPYAISGSNSGGSYYSYRAERIAVGDFNGDGRPDIAASFTVPTTSLSHGAMGVILNTGNGTGSRFGAFKQFNAHARTNPGGIAAGDLNRDGLDDIVLAMDSTDIYYGPQPEALWLMSRGDGLFQFVGGQMTMLQPNEVIIEDFNRDGKPDVAVNAYGQGTFSPSGITQHFNEGRISASVVTTGGTPQSIFVNQNGYNMEAIVLDANGNRVPFAPIVTTAPTTGPTTLLFGISGEIRGWSRPGGDFAVGTTANGLVGQYTATMRAVTGPGAGPTATFTLANITAAPIAGPDGPFTTPEDTPLVIPAPGLLANDTNEGGAGVPLAAHITNPLPTKGVVQIAKDGSFVYTPNANVSGTDTFKYHAWNYTNNSAAITVTVNITPVPDAPVVVNRSYNVNEDATLTVAAGGVLAGATDGDGTTSFTAQLAQQAANGTVVMSPNGAFTYQPNPNFFGVDTFMFTATDPTNLASLPGTITINVAPLFDPPVAVADSYTVNEDGVLTVAIPGLLANDVYNPDAVTTLATPPLYGTVTVGPKGSFVYTPNLNYHGPDSFEYDATEAAEGANRATVVLTVTSVNDAPAAGADAATTIVGAPASGQLLSNDTDIELDALTAELVAPPAHGQATVAANGTFTYTPGLNFVGSDAFTYRADDGSGFSTPATVTISVLPGATTTTLALSAPQVTLGQPVTLMASTGVIAPGAGIPGGVVTFYNGTTAIGSAALSGATASITVADLPLGTLSLSAAYAGSLAFGGSASATATLTVGANTPAGDNVVATPVDEATGASPITLQFPEVTTPGTTTLTITPTGPHAPSGFKLGTPPTYYNLETTAAFNGQVIVCFSYAEGSVGNENKVKLFHHENGHWTNITSSVDPDANIVCGKTTHFSPFAIGEPNEAPALAAIAATVDTAAPRLAVSASASFSDADFDDTHAAEWSWGDGTTSPASINGGVAGGSHTYASGGTYTIQLSLTDGGSVVSSTAVVQVGAASDTAGPAVTAAASLRELWPANNKMVAVTISGRITDDLSGVASASLAVVDEYGTVQPSAAITVGANGGYSVTVMLQASRNGNDKDGRLYSISVRAVDRAGNAGMEQTSTVVPHDQGKKK